MTRRPSQTMTLVLGGICAALVLLIILFWSGIGRGYSWWELDSADQAAANQAKLDHSQFKLAPWEAFAAVNERPLFNEDRKPTPPAKEDPGTVDQKPIPKLNVTLLGVIISSKVRMVMIKGVGKQPSTTVKEGHSLPGDLSAWNLEKVKPRGAVFKNAAGEDVEVELIATGNGQKPPQTGSPVMQQPIPPGPNQPGMPQGNQPPGEPALAKNPEQASAELQQRIDARRQQIREQNERAKQQAQPQQPPQQQ